MSRNTKIIIGVVAGLLVLCLIACGVAAVSFGLIGSRVARSVNTDPQSAGTTSQTIAEFDLPERFNPQSSVNILGVSVVVYETSQDEVLVLIQLPDRGEVTEENFQRLQEGMERSTGRTFRDIETIEARDETIRGKPGRVIIQEGTDSDGDRVRMMMAAFEGKSGLAMMMFVADSAVWDQATYDATVESIR